MKKLFAILAIVMMMTATAFKGSQDHLPPPSCPDGAVGQTVVTNQDGSATAYCTYPMGGGTYLPVATYTLACDYCVWQPVQNN